MAAKKTKKATAKKATTKKAATKKVTKAAKVKEVSVRAKVSGGKVQTIKASTLGQLKKDLGVDNYQATVDGEPQNDKNFKLDNDMLVILTAPVKGS